MTSRNMTAEIKLTVKKFPKSSSIRINADPLYPFDLDPTVNEEFWNVCSREIQGSPFVGAWGSGSAAYYVLHRAVARERADEVAAELLALSRRACIPIDMSAF